MYIQVEIFFSPRIGGKGAEYRAAMYTQVEIFFSPRIGGKGANKKKLA
jgi:hypothetical protein